MKVATAAYNLDPFENWSDYAAKIECWVEEAAGQDARLLLFPEYAAMELATLAGAEVAADPEGCLRAVSDLIPRADALHAELAAQFGVYICAGTGPVYDAAISARPVNRARLFNASGQVAAQDKQIMTRYERDIMEVVPGGPLQLFETDIGKIGILTCYDSEFPLLGRALMDADILLVPSCTEALSGYWRVRIGAMSRALETQCVTVMASLVGAFPQCPHASLSTGMGGVFGPPDKGFPETGVLAEGVIGQPGWTYAEIDRGAIAEVRANGRVLGRKHWTEQEARISAPPVVKI